MSTATKSAIKLQPLGNRVVVEREATEERTKGGIYVPEKAKEKPVRGRVVSVGTGKLLDNGKRQALQVKEGDRVLFSSWGPEEFKVGDQELLLLKEEDILAIITD